MALFQQSLIQSVMGDLQSTGYGLWDTRNVFVYFVSGQMLCCDT